MLIRSRRGWSDVDDDRDYQKPIPVLHSPSLLICDLPGETQNHGLDPLPPLARPQTGPQKKALRHKRACFARIAARPARMQVRTSGQRVLHRKYGELPKSQLVPILRSCEGTCCQSKKQSAALGAVRLPEPLPKPYLYSPVPQTCLLEVVARC